jgi:hypothetical protein
MKRNYYIVRGNRGGKELDATKPPTAIDVAWAAGIYEGEGTCSTKGGGNKSYTVCVSQKDPELLYRLRDWFGGKVTLYKNGVGKKGSNFEVHQWRLCGDRSRVFLGCIYPFLTARRKAQIDSTSARFFLDEVTDLLTPAFDTEPYSVCIALWDRLQEIVKRQHQKAAEHKKQRHHSYHVKKSQDPAWMEKRRLQTAQRRKLQKEQSLKVVGITKTA